MRMRPPGRSMEWIHVFGGDADEGGARADKRLLGGKGANLAVMSGLGLPVPPGFTITTEVCRAYLEEGRLPDELDEALDEQMARLERLTGRAFGPGEGTPLLVSVRSGGAVSMPGMMDTILNLGLGDDTVEALAGATGDARFAFDCYRRFVQMYGDVVLGVDPHRFEALLTRKKEERGVEVDAELDADALRELVAGFRGLLEEASPTPLPADPREQLRGAVEAVFRSWNNARARAYRRVHAIPDDAGTAVNVMVMVFGNLGDDSGTGVAFTRNPATGEPGLYGELLVNAQGEDVVAGIRDPLGIDAMDEHFPEPARRLRDVAKRLEAHYRDMQDLEFTVEEGTLWMLQTRTGKRTADAAVRMATDMVDEGLIQPREAVLRVEPSMIDQLLHPRIDPDAEVEELVRGLPASPGAAVGKAVLTPARAREWKDRGEAVVLVREETSPDDFDGMVAAEGILTARGGMTSHAAVVARGMGKCAVVGAAELVVHEDEGRFTAGERTLAEGDWITLDGTTGRVLLGQVPTVEPEPGETFRRLMGWADEARRLKVRANADTPADARRARENGAEGIGLCRTEHMFFEGERLHAMRRMILADGEEGRRAALEELLPMQRGDFEGLFEAMDGLPVTVRLLDPPLHEFLPRSRREVRALARRTGTDEEALREAVAAHREANPMLGHRGVRLAITFPEITEMQARAVFEAAVAVAGRGVDVHPEVMVPVVATAEEVRRQREVVERVAEEVFDAAGRAVPYQVGTMIELPRAALTAGEVASHADFFSFGTNDLTQTTLGLSRDDSGTFLPFYVEHGILPVDPFRTIDREGVGRLVRIAVKEGREAKPELHLGICGEHGGDPASVGFFHEAGLDYVSCSPFRVPVARLAAAHAALAEERRETEGE